MRYAKGWMIASLLALAVWSWLWLHPYYNVHENVVLAIFDMVSAAHALFSLSSAFLWSELALVGSLCWLVWRGGIPLGAGRKTYGTARSMSSTEARRRYGHRSLRLQLPRLHRVNGTRSRVRFSFRSRGPSSATLTLGSFQGIPIRLSEQDQTENIILTAPVGAGKTSGIIVPNLLREPGTRSLLIPDVKSELYRLTAGRISQHHEIWRFAPTQAAESLHYNPLASIHNYEDAQEFARCWVENTGHAKDDFWPNTATKLLTGTVMHLRAAEPGAPFSRVGDILCTLTFEELKQLFQKSPSQVAQEELTAFYDYMEKNEKLVGSLMVDIGTRFQLLRSVSAVTVRNDINFSAMTQRPIALYLSIPRRYAARYQPLLACFLMQAFLTWEEIAEVSPGGRLPQAIIAYLDEFANLGYIPNFSTYITTARHTRIALLLAIQSFAQLDERYGRPVRETILTNCRTHLLLPGAGLDETRYYSERIGDTTVTTTTATQSRSGKAAWGTAPSYSSNWSTAEARRRLFTSEELRTLPRNKMLVLGSSEAPLVLTTHPWYNDRRLARLVNLPCARVVVTEDRRSELAPIDPEQPTSQGAGPFVVDADPSYSQHFQSDEDWS